MPPKLIVDPATLDFATVIHGREEIRKTVPQRFEMEQLNAIHLLDREAGIAVASRSVTDDEWWARGHLPDRPIFPGVLMVEAAAQLSTWLFKALVDDDRFMGFGALDGVRFRSAVIPPADLLLVAKVHKIKSRRAVFDTQALLDGRLVFEGRVTGMAV